MYCRKKQFYIILQLRSKNSLLGNMHSEIIKQKIHLKMSENVKHFSIFMLNKTVSWTTWNVCFHLFIYYAYWTTKQKILQIYIQFCSYCSQNAKTFITQMIQIYDITEQRVWRSIELNLDGDKTMRVTHAHKGREREREKSSIQCKKGRFVCLPMNLSYSIVLIHKAYTQQYIDCDVNLNWPNLLWCQCIFFFVIVFLFSISIPNSTS